MSTVDRPVTQMTDTAVKRASASGVALLVVVAIGKENSRVNTRMSRANTRMANLDGLRLAKTLTASRTRSAGVIDGRRAVWIARMDRSSHRRVPTWYSGWRMTSLGEWPTSLT